MTPLSLPPAGKAGEGVPFWRVGLIADTQGSFDVAALLAHVAQAFAGMDEIWHAGDWGCQEVLDGLVRMVPLVVVNGNAPDDPRYPMTVERTISLPPAGKTGEPTISLPPAGRVGEGVSALRLGMIHNLDAKAQRWAREFDVVIHGHTHRWRDETIGRTRFINPGTATRPQFGGTERTIARLIFGPNLTVEKLEVPQFAVKRTL